MSGMPEFFDRATGEPIEPEPYRGVGVDWEVYDRERPRRAVAYIGAISVAEVRSHTRTVLFLKMLIAGWRHRRTTQAARTPVRPVRDAGDEEGTG